MRLGGDLVGIIVAGLVVMPPFVIGATVTIGLFVFGAALAIASAGVALLTLPAVAIVLIPVAPAEFASSRSSMGTAATEPRSQSRAAVRVATVHRRLGRGGVRACP
jgi:hypothetical protein